MTVTAYELRKAVATDSAATDFTAKIPVTALPTSVGFHDLQSGDYGFSTQGTARVPDAIFVQPFGTNSDNDVFLFRVWGWSKVYGEALYVPHLMLEATATVGNIAEGTASTFMADTIVVVAAHAEADTSRTFNITPALDKSASIIIPTRGCRWIEFDFDLSTGAAGMNAYWKPIDNL